MIREEISKRLKEIRKKPIGFKCWDCEKIIDGIDVEDGFYKGNPISLDGYIKTFCYECANNAD